MEMETYMGSKIWSAISGLFGKRKAEKPQTYVGYGKLHIGSPKYW